MHGLCVVGESVEVVDDFPDVVIDGAINGCLDANRRWSSVPARLLPSRSELVRLRWAGSDGNGSDVACTAASAGKLGTWGPDRRGAPGVKIVLKP